MLNKKESLLDDIYNSIDLPLDICRIISDFLGEVYRYSNEFILNYADNYELDNDNNIRKIRAYRMSNSCMLEIIGDRGDIKDLKRCIYGKVYFDNIFSSDLFYIPNTRELEYRYYKDRNIKRARIPVDIPPAKLEIFNAIGLEATILPIYCWTTNEYIKDKRFKYKFYIDKSKRKDKLLEDIKRENVCDNENHKCNVLVDWGALGRVIGCQQCNKGKSWYYLTPQEIEEVGIDIIEPDL